MLLVGISLLVDLPISEVFGQFFRATLGSKFGILSMLNRTTYLLVVSLGLCVAFGTGIWNLGGEGQILWGGMLTVVIALLLDLPVALLVLLAFIASFLAGGVWGSIAGFLKAKWNVNEIVATLMLNFVAWATMVQIAGGPLRDPILLIEKTRMIPQELHFPYLGYPLNIVFLIALALIPVIYLLTHKTTLGYKLRMVGASKAAAAYAGINTGRMMTLCMFISGGICALAGTMLVFGRFFRAEPEMTGLYGFYAIVCTLLGKMKPQRMFFTSLLVAFILTGIYGLRVIGVPGGFADVMIGVLFVIAVLPELLARRFKRH